MSSGRQQDDSVEKDQLKGHEKYKNVVKHDEKTFTGSTSQESTEKFVKIDSSNKSEDEIKKSIKIDIPKNDNPSVDPRYSSEKPIILNKLPIFDKGSRLP